MSHLRFCHATLSPNFMA